MKKPRNLIILLFAGFVLTACSKTVMQEPAPAEQEPEPVAQAEPAPEPAAPAPLPQVPDSGEKDRALFMHDHVYFDFDSAALRPDAKALLKMKIQWLQDNPDVLSVLIEGHCDERGTDAYNLALGAKRARSVKAYLVEEGIDSVTLNTKSLGEERPLDPRSVEEAWAKNRRVSFVLN